MKESAVQAFVLLQAQQIDVAAGLLSTVAHGAQIAVVLDPHAGRLDALGQEGGQAVGDLLVQAALVAILGAVSEEAQGVVGHGGAFVEVAGVVGLRQVEGLAPGASGERAQQSHVLRQEHLVGVED